MSETKANAPPQRPKSMNFTSELATELLSAADAMHAALLEQAKGLMLAEAGTRDGEKLARIAAVIENYEQARWPM